MPKKFVFNGPSFSCFLDCDYCSHYLEKKKRYCKVYTCIGVPYCRYHLQKEKKLKIKPSQILDENDEAVVMSGLYAYDESSKEKPIFKKNSWIVAYNGEKVSKQELGRRYGTYTAPYGITVNKKKDIYEDGACKRGLGTLINHGPQNIANVNFRERAMNPGSHIPSHMWIKSIRDIYHNTELIANYGNEYDLKELGASHKTTRKSYSYSHDRKSLKKKSHALKKKNAIIPANKSTKNKNKN